MINKERYTRQIALPEIGEQGQQLLLQSSVLVVGVGGLGSPVSTLLASSGVGRVGIVDFDIVSLSNLPRQTLYTTEDIGKSKVERAAARLEKMNPECIVECYDTVFDDTSALEIMKGYDMVVDGCDNMATRYTIDRCSRELGIPYIYGAISGFVGQLSVFNYQGAGGYSDLYPRSNAPEVGAPPAVMATTPAIIGALEVAEVIKLIVGYGENLAGRLLTFDSRDYSINILKI